jgi:hypothetical protein
MGECERSNKSVSVVYSARLLWRTVSSTRVLVSVLNVERRNVSVSTTRHPEIETQQRYQKNRDEKSWGSFGIPNAVKVRRKEIKTKRKKKKKERGSKLKCHLCKLVLFSSTPSLLPFIYLTNKGSNNQQSNPRFPNLTPSPYTTTTSSSPAYTPSPSPKYTDPPPSYSLSLIYLPISKSQPPNPPLRSSSLPFFKHLKRIQIIPRPAVPPTAFRLNERERVVWRYFIEKGGGVFKYDDGEIWRVVLQASESDVGIRCFGLAVSALAFHQPHYNIGIDARKYHLTALRILTTQFRSKLCLRDWDWEVIFLSLYLLTLFDLLKGNKKRARSWMGQGYRVLKRALKIDDEEGMALPGCMRVVALAFGRLDLRTGRI